jgi:NAD(P)-dependent dehydrogenase (short-subunit alcohol dehydrogenase family)
VELDIEGLRVLVTAGGAGIGRAIVDAFLAEGALVFTCDVDQAALDTLPQAAGRLAADVSDRAQVKALFDAAIGAMGGLDVLVNNAGVAGPTGKVEDINPEDWDHCLDVCLTG